jgi:hypothetical protein
MAADVRVTLEPIRLQALANIALLEAAHAPNDVKKQRFIGCLRKLVSELNDICGPGMGIDVRFGPPPNAGA